LEFIDLPKKYKEHNLQKAIVSNLKEFIWEFGKNFAFVGEDYRVQVESNSEVCDFNKILCEVNENEICQQ